MPYKEIDTQAEFADLLKETEFISHVAFQSIDFSKEEQIACKREYEDCIFLGCTLPDSLNDKIKNSLVFPKIDVPYNSFTNCLYTKDSLYDKYVPGKPDSYLLTPDRIVYDHYINTGKEADDIKETLARRLHDHAVTDALYDFLEQYDEKKVVAIMGGHSLARNNPMFEEIAHLSKLLTEKGYLMVSGGGPGAMEATHLGAWMAGRSDDKLTDAIETIKSAPIYSDPLWLDKAFEVLSKYPATEYESLGIPTWLYGHEPPTPFATKIAKYFANSVREDGLLTIAKGGVIYSPGSAGTLQEIFQDVTQNHYLSVGYASPMVFLGKDYWTSTLPIYPLLQALSAEQKLNNLRLSLYDKYQEVADEIESFK